jgi:type IV secretion system protein TrbJ
MNNLKTILSAMILTLMIGLSTPSHAVDLVFDMEAAIADAESLANDAEALSNQVTQIQNQVQQYENMVQNTVAPAAYLWDQAQQKMNMLRNISGTIDGYINRFGTIDGYLNKFQDVGYYRSSPCFKIGNCTQAQLQAIHDNLSFGSETQKKSNDSAFRDLQAQRDQLTQDSRNLERLQSQISGYDGQMEALQGANQLASMQVNQLMQLREMLATANAAILQRQQAIQNVEAMQQATAQSQRDYQLIPTANNKSWKLGE